jgi:hypothetical protein
MLKKIYNPDIGYKLIHGIFTKNLSRVNTWLKDYMRRLRSLKMRQ